MPALPAVPNVLKVIWKSVLDEDVDVVNVTHWQYSGTAPTDADLTEWAEDMMASWGTNMATQLSDHVALVEVEAIDLTSSTAAQGAFAGNVPGTGTGGRVGAGTALVISKEIARRYRGGHPRQYIAGMESANLQDSQTWNSTTVAAMTVAWIGIQTDAATNLWAGGSSLVEVNISYFQGFTNHTYPSGRVRAIPNLRVTPLVDVVAGVKTNPKVASQRRRNLQGS